MRNPRMAMASRRTPLVHSLRIAEGRAIRIRLLNGEDITIKRVYGSVFLVDSPKGIKKNG